MRLYLNAKEVHFIRMGLKRILSQDTSLNDEDRGKIGNVLFRIDLCEKLQENERRSKDNA